MTRAEALRKIQAVKAYMTSGNPIWGVTEMGEAFDMAIKALEEPQWISCSERLPKDGRQVLVYARSTHYALAKYDEMREADGTYKKQWVTFDAWKPFYTIKEVLAWIPLPEAWRGDAE